MGKFTPDTGLRLLADWVADNATSMHVCEATDITGASGGLPTGTGVTVLATFTMTVGDGNGDYTVADGNTSGKMLTVAAQTGTSNGLAAGTPNHYAWTDGTTGLYYVTTASGSDVSVNADVSTAEVDIAEVRDPS